MPMMQKTHIPASTIRKRHFPSAASVVPSVSLLAFLALLSACGGGAPGGNASETGEPDGSRTAAGNPDNSQRDADVAALEQAADAAAQQAEQDAAQEMPTAMLPGDQTATSPTDKDSP